MASKSFHNTLAQRRFTEIGFRLVPQWFWDFLVVYTDFGVVENISGFAGLLR